MISISVKKEVYIIERDIVSTSAHELQSNQLDNVPAQKHLYNFITSHYKHYENKFKWIDPQKSCLNIFYNHKINNVSVTDRVEKLTILVDQVATIKKQYDESHNITYAEKRDIWKYMFHELLRFFENEDIDNNEIFIGDVQLNEFMNYDPSAYSNMKVCVLKVRFGKFESCTKVTNLESFDENGLYSRPRRR